MHSQNRQKGTDAETLAAGYLRQMGFAILGRNQTLSHDGEIDIVAEDSDGTIVFVEVKAQFSDEFGAAEFRLTARKLKRMEGLAHRYLYIHNLVDRSCRFDAMVVDYTRHPRSIHHYTNIYTAHR